MKDRSTVKKQLDPGVRKALEQALAFGGGELGPRILWDAFSAGQVDQKTLAVTLPGVWSAVEFPRSSLPTKAWVALFEAAKLPRPKVKGQLYRGAPSSFARGLAWTLDPDKAEGFAKRWSATENRPAFVYATEAMPDAILAGIGERSELDIVVDPAKLGPVRRRPVPAVEKQ